MELGKHLNLTETAAIVMIIVGCILFIISILGSYGAMAESHCMLISFSVIVFFFLLGELLLAAFIVSRSDPGSQMNNMLRNRMEQMFKEYNPDGQEDAQNWLFDTIQRNFRCCGVQGMDDWLVSNKTRSLPPSCCYQKQAKGLKEGSTYCRDGQYVPELGCLDQISSVISDNMYIIGGTALLLAIVETVAILMAYWLSCAIKTCGE
ncbi:CD63 antigen-like isoform X2 [Brevipalpus obovatus]